MFRCKDCRKQFSYKRGTIFEDSPLGLDKWFVAAWAIGRNRISTHALARALNVTQKTAWLMFRRIREKPDLAVSLNRLVKQANRSPVELTLIETFDELADNFNTFQREARNHGERAMSVLRSTRYWVHDSTSSAFGPGKFLGYRRMDFLNYDLAKLGKSTGAQFQGTESKLAIQSVIVHEFARNASLIPQCQAWAERLLGPGAFGNASTDKWRFITIQLPGRESTPVYPDEVTQPERYTEGALKTVTVNVYERNPAARRACIAHYGARCNVCGLSFPEHYDGLGEGFIHVHHLKLLSDIGQEYEIDPIHDLRPVCPNCHAMLHIREPPLTIDELRQRLCITSPPHPPRPQRMH